MRCATRPLARLLACSVALAALVVACAPAPPPAPPAAGGGGERSGRAAPADQRRNRQAGHGPERVGRRPRRGAGLARSGLGGGRRRLVAGAALPVRPARRLRGPELQAGADARRDLDRRSTTDVWEFKLRRGVTFHNGDAFSAADVKYSFDVYADERSARQNSLEAVASVEQVDPYTIRLHTTAPSPALLTNLAMLNDHAARRAREGRRRGVRRPSDRHAGRTASSSSSAASAWCSRRTPPTGAARSRRRA